ncbi:MAG: hypothetical protein C0502_03195 [Opitutus sp.]|nr:hypothetical protein [Opitutus sp.]
MNQSTPLLRVLPWAISAGFAGAAAWFAIRSDAFRAETDSLRAQQELAEVTSKMAQSQLAERTLLAEGMIAELGRKLRLTEDIGRLKVAALAARLPNLAEARAIVVWDPALQSGLLVVSHLPAIAGEQDYQIWIHDPRHPTPINGGVFKPGVTGHATVAFKGEQPLSQAVAFAISLERKGGAPKSEGPVVLLGNL